MVDGSESTITPNFFLIGAQKAGTTTIAHQLGTHPDVFVSDPKEPRFFSQSSYFGAKASAEGGPPPTLEDYLALYASAGAATAIGEASVQYLAHHHAPERIASHFPGARLVAVLRDPVERAYSAWLHASRDQLELSFLDAVAADATLEGANRRTHMRYVNDGRYATHVQRWLLHFPRERMHLVLYDDLVADPTAFYGTIFDFLGVARDVDLDTDLRLNQSGTTRSPAVERLLRHPAGQRTKAVVTRLVPRDVLRRWRDGLVVANSAAPPALDPATRALVYPHFEREIDELEVLLDRPLDRWHHHP